MSKVQVDDPIETVQENETLRLENSLLRQKFNETLRLAWANRDG